MGLGLGALGLSPDVFWAMTLKELAAAIRGRHGPAPAAPLSRSDLDGLMGRFPDVVGASGTGAIADERGAS
jgi:uncharacterized phage protein (TIGR02216 family)